MVTRPPVGTIPTTPGSYQFKDASGRVIYVGKAKNLRSRLNSYFQDPRNLHLSLLELWLHHRQGGTQCIPKVYW